MFIGTDDTQKYERYEEVIRTSEKFVIINSF